MSNNKTNLKVTKAGKSESKPLKVTMDSAMYITPSIVKKWLNPPFQRPLKINAKVIALSEEMRIKGGIIPGLITLGVFNGNTYLLDGQHRREAFLLSECGEGLVSVIIKEFSSMADMGQEFVNLNSSLVRLRPDDILRGLEGSSEGLGLIRKRCPWVGYDMIRRGPTSPIVSMSALLKCWFGSETETPANLGIAAAELVRRFSAEEAEKLSEFLNVAMSAWGKDKAYDKLWNNLNLTLCMWLWRRLVLSTYSAKVGRMSKEQFSKCMMALSANSDYIDWLFGRQMREKDRSPAYRRIKETFARRVEKETGKKPLLPSPEWSSH